MTGVAHRVSGFGDEDDGEPLFDTPEQEEMFFLRMLIPSPQVTDDLEAVDMPWHRDEPRWTHIPQADLSEGWLAGRKRLDASESIAHIAWRKRTVDAEDPSVVTVERLPGELIQAPRDTIDAMFALDCTSWIHILQHCSLMDVLALRATCRFLSVKFSGHPTHLTPVHDFRGASRAMVAAIDRWEAGELSATELLGEYIIDPVRTLHYMSSVTDYGAFDWAALLRAMATQRLLAPFNVSVQQQGAGSSTIRFNDQSYGYRKQTYRLEGKSTSRGGYWGTGLKLERIKERFSAGAYCLDCMRRIRRKAVVPFNWKRFTFMPNAICMRCLSTRRSLRSDLAVYLIPGATWKSMLPSSAFDNGPYSLENLRCPNQRCMEHRIVLLRRASTYAMFGVGYCTNVHHPMFFTFVERRNKIVFCHEEIQRWMNWQLEPCDEWRKRHGTRLPSTTLTEKDTNIILYGSDTESHDGHSAPKRNKHK